MDIYLTEISTGQRLRIPLLPDRLSIKTGALSVSVNVIKEGEIKIPRGSSLTGYSWNGVFPSKAMVGASFVFDWQEPVRIISQLVEWEKSNAILRLMITELSINTDVFIESFNGDYYGIGDYSYTINLTTKKELSIVAHPQPTAPQEETGVTPEAPSKTYGIVTGERINIRQQPSTSSKILDTVRKGHKLEILGKNGNWYNIVWENGIDGKAYIYASYVKIEGGSGSSGNGSGKVGSKSSASGSGSVTYIVKQGDSLWSIAKTQLGDGDRLEEIYNLNKAAIDAYNAGTKNLKYALKVGMKLILPAKSTTKTAASSALNKSIMQVAYDYGAVRPVVVQKLVTEKPSRSLIDAVKSATQKPVDTRKTE